MALFCCTPLHLVLAYYSAKCRSPPRNGYVGSRQGVARQHGFVWPRCLTTWRNSVMSRRQMCRRSRQVAHYDAKPEYGSEQKLYGIPCFYCSANRHQSGCKHLTQPSSQEALRWSSARSGAASARGGDLGRETTARMTPRRFSLTAANNKTIPCFFSAAT